MLPLLALSPKGILVLVPLVCVPAVLVVVPVVCVPELTHLDLEKHNQCLLDFQSGHVVSYGCDDSGYGDCLTGQHRHETLFQVLPFVFWNTPTNWFIYGSGVARVKLENISQTVLLPNWVLL